MNPKKELTELVEEIMIYHGLPQKGNDDEFSKSYAEVVIHLINQIIDKDSGISKKRQKELIDYLDYDIPTKEIEKLISPMCIYELYILAQK
ncbi:MAG: hypothetical protein ACTSQS_18190 [Promethearchaeota archaeon]